MKRLLQSAACIFMALFVVLAAACTTAPLPPTPAAPAAPAAPTVETAPPPPETATSQPAQPLPTPAAPQVELPPALERVRQALALSLGVSPAEVQLESYEPVDWPDSCLGVPGPEEMCAQVITPGFLGVFIVGGVRYEFRIDQTGAAPRFIPEAVSVARRALAAALDLYEQDVLVVGFKPATWSNGCLDLPRPGEGCTEALVPGYRVLLQAGGYPYEYHTDLSGSSLRPTAGLLNVPATPAGPQTGIALTWHREGGIAGFCDDVTVHLSGEVLVSTCRGSTPGAPLQVWLSAARRAQLSAWLNDLKAFNFETPAMAVADAMLERIQFNGLGEQTAVESDIQAISELASLQAALAATPADLQKMNAAQLALHNYFDGLNAADYPAVTALYGGSYDPLASINPDLDASDRPALFARACATNGFVCTLKIGAVIETMPIEAGAFRFVLELTGPDGNPFALGPCCGEDPAVSPPLTHFAYELYPVGGQYRVWDLPVYVP